MSVFINPAILGGLALVGIPIVLHLLMRRKPKRIEFPALRFIQLTRESTQRRMRFQHILLLALRVLIIMLVVLAMARPRSSGLSAVLGDDESPVAVALVFDCSARMQYKQANLTRLDEARALALQTLSELPRGSKIAVCDNRRGPKAFQVDLGAARTAVERLTTVASGVPLPMAAEEALRLLEESELPHRELFLFTDLSRAAWPVESGESFRRQLTSAAPVTVYIVDVGSETPVNDSIGELNLQAQVLSPGQALRISTDVSRIAPPDTPADPRKILLEIIDDSGKEQVRDEATVNLRAAAVNDLSESAEDDMTGEDGDATAATEDAASISGLTDENIIGETVDLSVGGLERGTHQGRLRMTGSDGLPTDDIRYFTVEVGSPWRVLILAPEPAKRRALYTAEALAPSALRARGEVRFDTKVASYLEQTSQDFAQYDAIILLDPPELGVEFWRDLGDYVASGGGLGVFLGRDANVESLNNETVRKLLPGVPIQQAKSSTGDIHPAPSASDYSHPILEPLRPIADEIPWHAMPIYRYWQIDQIKEKGVDTVITLSDGRPMLLERTVGEGRVLLCVTPFSDPLDPTAWNLFAGPDAWPAVMTMYQSATYLVGGLNVRLNYLAEETVVLPLGPTDPRGAYQLFAPDGLHFPIQVESTDRRIVFSTTDQIGNYKVGTGGERGVHRGFSVNFAPDQTRLVRTDRETLDTIFGEHEFRIARNRRQLEGDQHAGRVGMELFPLLIVLAAIALAGEHFIANRFYRQKK